MFIPKFTQEIKDEIDKKNALLKEKEELAIAIRNGREWFLKEEKLQGTAKELSAGAIRMCELIDNLKDIEARILDIDILIVAKVEAYMGDFVAKITIPEKISDAGDIVGSKTIYAVPFNTDDRNYIEVTPNDVWFLKLIKQAFGANNLEVIDKELYYK